MVYAKNWPTSEEAAATFANDDALISAIADMPSYRKIVSVLTIGEEMTMTPEFLRAVADFATIVSKQIGYEMTLENRQFNRPKTDEELRDAVIQERRSHMYYHPEDYGLETKPE